ncbi:M48 metallopeptidase family protein [Halomonas sp. LBP4]|uniref:M48 metallopeptidase family protein n=1 Tax=Halomonas sp. LBP4 TaxID=2044917 RepID=UPI0021AD038E|nr:M48 family metallopeptidase [Halomonas sp. LBP4]
MATSFIQSHYHALSALSGRAPGVKVQDLGYRWGSCGKGNRVYFHWKTILQPRHIAEHVVVNELVYLHESHHITPFWRRLERAMPDYEQRKVRLARHGIEVEGI